MLSGQRIGDASTVTGRFAEVTPLPRPACGSLPQQYTCPASLRAHENRAPETSSTQGSPSRTRSIVRGMGTASRVGGPAPSAAAELSPQHWIVPPQIAHACRSPAATAVHPDSPATRLGVYVGLISMLVLPSSA